MFVDGARTEEYTREVQRDHGIPYRVSISKIDRLLLRWEPDGALAAHANLAGISDRP